MSDLQDCQVLVTPTSFARHDARLREALESRVGRVIYNPHSRPLTSEELQALLPGCDGFIAGLDYVDRAALASADKLKVIARYGSGVDRVDLDAARARGVIVTNTPGVNAVSVAELTIGLMLSLARSIPEAVASTRAGGWQRLSGMTLEDKTIGLLGFGAIGKEVARRLRAFRCNVIAFDPMPDVKAALDLDVRLADREEVVESADFLSLHLPAFAETNGMVNAAFLSQMKPGAFLINTARGELIDEAALYDAITTGQVRGAALDCFREEPPDPAHPLLALPQVIALPHLGANTDGATNAMGWCAFNDCMAVLEGRLPEHPVG